MSLLRAAGNRWVQLVLNVIYALGNCCVGLLAHSWWFIAVGAYYTVLSVTRFSVLVIEQKSREDHTIVLFAGRITGIFLVVLSICIIGVNVLAAVKERGTAMHEIVMIAVAAYTFVKITIAVIGMARAKRSPSSVRKTLRNISLADACVSVYTMQRSMLVSFPGMAAEHIRLLNIFTGTAVWLTVLCLGINLIRNNRKVQNHEQ